MITFKSKDFQFTASCEADHVLLVEYDNIGIFQFTASCEADQYCLFYLP